MKRYKVKPKLFGFELKEDDSGEVVMYEDAYLETRCLDGSRWNGLSKDQAIEVLESRLGEARREINDLNRKVEKTGNYGN